MSFNSNEVSINKPTDYCGFCRKKGDSMRKRLYALLGIILFAVAIQTTMSVQAAEPLVVVIDPGHGGDNLGTDYLPIPEKDYDFIVAMYMKAYLEQYQDVKVYLTRTGDVAMSHKERAQFAKSVNADFLFSLHFNASLDHTYYGAEVWIPSSGSAYSQGYGLANEFLTEFQEMGIYNRGIKTRIGKTGNDYYGIIRQCALVNIPSVIVEHCHVDHPYDVVNLQSDDRLREFGERDARAVARYFGLTSIDNKTSYKDYAPLAVPTPQGKVYQDSTSPEIAIANLVKYDNSNKTLTCNLTASDNETYIQYYAYSFDNGLSWSILCPWNGTNNTMTITVNNVPAFSGTVMFKVWNQYDQSTDTNVITY